MVRVIKESSEILDFAWELCQDNTKVSYPRVNSKEELENRIDRYINLDNGRVIGYYKDDKLIGICMYFWIYEDEYAQTVAILIKENYNLVADEIMEYIKSHLGGYRILIGITAYNKEAIDYFKEREVSCIDASYVTKLFKRNYKNQELMHKIIKLGFGDFDEYAKFHDKYAENIYWNSKNLREVFDNFVIFICRDGDEIKGSIFIRKMNSREVEVVGLLIDDTEKEKSIIGALIGEASRFFYEEYKEMDEILYFIEEDSKEELDYAMGYGFEIKDRYRLYEIEL